MGNSKARTSERTTKPNKKTKEEKMALNINTFSPFSMRSAFDDSFFSKRWSDDWMVPSRNLDNQFKEFRSLFNKEEELKVSVQSGRLLVEGRHEEKKEDGSGYIQ